MLLIVNSTHHADEKEQIKIPLLDQETVVHLHNGILRRRKRGGAPSLRDSTDGTGEHYAK